MLASHLACLHLRAIGSLQLQDSGVLDPITLGYREGWGGSATLQFRVPPKGALSVQGSTRRHTSQR